MAFYAKYPSTNVSVSGVSTVQGEGTAGTPVGGVLTVQGDPAGTPIPISGSITATNPSVSSTGAAVPASATFVGGKNAGNLVGLSADGSGNLVAVGAGVAGTPSGGVVSIQGVASGTVVPISGTVSGTGNFTVVQPTAANLNATVVGSGNFTVVQPSGAALHVDVDNFPATQPVSGTVAATQSGTWTVQPGNTANTTPWLATINQGGNSASVTGANALKVDGSAVTQPVSGTVTANAGTGTFQTNQVVSNATFQNEGPIAFSALTTSFQTVFTSAGALVWVGLRNNTNGIVVCSLDGGTTNTFFLDPGDFVSLDLKSDGRTIPTSTNIQAAYSGAAPTSGNFRVNGYY